MSTILLNIIHSYQRLYWRVFRPITVGVRAVVVDREHRLILVRHTYQPGWYLPGGRVRRGELLLHALSRELNEEVGIEIQGLPTRLLGIYSNSREFKTDHVAVFVVESWRQHAARHLEIAESRFFSVHELPSDVTPATRRRILEWLDKAPVTYQW